MNVETGAIPLAQVTPFSNTDCTVDCNASALIY